MEGKHFFVSIREEMNASLKVYLKMTGLCCSEAKFNSKIRI